LTQLPLDKATDLCEIITMRDIKTTCHYLGVPKTESLTNLENLAVDACRMAYTELNQWHQAYHAGCPGGCPTAEAMDACRAVIDAGSPVSASEPAALPVASPAPQMPAGACGASEATPPDVLTVLRSAEKWAMLTQTDPVPWLDDASAVIAAAGRPPTNIKDY
jgi:hypothetical protein